MQADDSAIGDPAGTVAAWTVVIPFFNEEAFLPATLASLAAQTLRPFALVLVDNGSTDGSRAAAERWAADQTGIATSILAEPTPGQVHALARGIEAVTTPCLAVADADTFYPPHYLATADRLLRAAPADLVGYIAHDQRSDPQGLSARAQRWFYSHVANLVMPRQAHGGGYGHCMRTAPFRASGGYSARLWPYVLKDHELANRLWKQGRIAMDEGLWCHPSDRRADRRRVRWTLRERLVYHLSPPFAKDWFWYDYMKGRFEARNLRDTVLRERDWVEPDPIAPA